MNKDSNLWKEFKIALLEFIFNRRMFWKNDIKLADKRDKDCPINAKVVIIWNNKYLKEDRKIYLTTLRYPESTFFTLQTQRTLKIVK